MRKCFLFQVLFLLIIGNIHTLAQTERLQQLDSYSGTFIKQVRSIDKEKAYLITDKSIYTAGESVWFRSFLLHSISNKISVQSSFLFVDLVNDSDHILLKTILNSQQQQTNGKLSLPETLSTGYYWIRAYTKTMAAKDSDYAAVVPLYVINPANPASHKLNDHKKSTSINEQPVYLEMFPEGGNLVTGINSTIGFYLHDLLGNPLSQTIFIKDNRDSIISTSTTNINGFSKTEFFPYFFRKYRAVVLLNGKEFNFPLPSFNRFAGQLSMISDNGAVLKLRTVLEDSIYKAKEITYLLGISGDSLCFAGIGYGSYETEVLKTKFPNGIATFILFDKNFNYLSERSIYLKEENVIIKANLNKTTFSKRSKAILSTSILDKNNLPIHTTLSIAIIDSNSIVPNNNFSVATILKNAKYGTINNWNLIHLSSISDADKDIIMLCKPPFYKNLKIETVGNYKAFEDSLFNINGVVIDPKGQPLNNKVLNLLYLSENNSFFTDTTDKAGRFSFPVTRYMDSTQFVIQISNFKGKIEEAKVVIDNLPAPLFSTPTHLKENLDLPVIAKMAYSRYYIDTTLIGNGKELLKPVTVNTKAKNYYDHSGRMSSNTSVLTSEELLRLGMGSIGIAILRLPGVQLNNGYILINGPNDTKGVNASSEPIVLMDGVQMSIPNFSVGAFSSPVMQFLNSLNPREIEFIEVLKGTEASIYGLRGSNGVISIHSSSDIKQDIASSDNKGTFKFYRHGIAKPNDYPEINYDQKKGKDFSFTDARSTLFWKGNVITVDREPLLFNFTTNDIPGHYKVVITGVTIHGDLIYQILSFTNL